MKRLLLPRLLLLALILGSASPLLADPSYDIELLEGTISPPAGVDRALLDSAARAAAAAGVERLHLLVQLYAVPDADQREELARRGLELGDYVSGNAWMAAVPTDGVRALAFFPEVRFALPWSAAHKLHPRILRRDFAEWARVPERPEWVMLFVQLHSDVSLERLAAIAERVGGVAFEPVETLHGATVWVPERELRALAELEEVAWVEEGAPPLEPTNDGVRSATRARPLADPPYGLDGRGVKLFVFDAGSVSPTHESLIPNGGSTRVTLLDGSPVIGHATHVAGTAAGDGSGSPGERGRGIAPAASLLSAAYTRTPGSVIYFYDNSGDIEKDFSLARNVYDADLANVSIGSHIANNGFNCAREGDYGVSGRMLDLLVRGDSPKVRDPMIMTWAVGNERNGGGLPRGICGSNYGNIPPPACAKNPIQVGAVNSDGLSMTPFSSWGPCDDGRMKPIAVTPGCETGVVSGAEDFIYSAAIDTDSAYGSKGYCGTSMASPGAAGIATLFIQDWRKQGFGSPKTRPLPALVKAFMIHTAKDLGQPGPDFTYGYGELDAKAMIDFLRAGRGVLGQPGDPVIWGTGKISDSQTLSWSYRVPENAAELKASLAWDDAAAANYALYAPVNDLTLELIAPNGDIHDAFVLSSASPHQDATRGLNFVDNQEQVLVTSPQAGIWTVRVKAPWVPVGPQTFGLLYAAKLRGDTNCNAIVANFESGDDGFDFNGPGAARTAAPDVGHGAYAVKVGGYDAATAETWRKFAIPSTATRATLGYWIYETTEENAGPTGWGFDFDYFTVEIRDLTDHTLAVVDNRNDGWKTGVWMQHAEVDLLPYKGTTVKVIFRAVTNVYRPTSWWLDDLTIATCGP